MLIAALEFMLCRSREIGLSILYSHACREIRAASVTLLSTFGDQQSLDPSVDSESVVLYLTPYVALRRHSIKHLWGKTCQHYLASPAAAVVPSNSPLAYV